MIRVELQETPYAYEPQATLSLRVAEAVKNELARDPQLILGLPTGRTPTGVYSLLSRWCKEGELSFKQAKCFGLDEYCDVDESESFKRYLENNLYKDIDLPAYSRFNPMFHDDYDRLIAESGGLGLTILGIGKNGHIAFNEPGTPLSSWTHGVYLTESTRQANAEFFKKSAQIPYKAVTMGIQTILSSKRIILMASGKSKSAVLKRAFEGPITDELPASFLQLHKNVSVFTDFEY
jgi:glucosamine-6-phosphate deaminase